MNQLSQPKRYQNIFQVRNQTPERQQLGIQKFKDRKRMLRYGLNYQSEYQRKQKHIKNNKQKLAQQNESNLFKKPFLQLPQLCSPKSPLSKSYQLACQTVEQTRRARQLILRIQKQKQYNEGKYLLMRRRQQDRKSRQQKRKIRRQQEQVELYQSDRLRKMMENILVHEEKINIRIAESLNRLKKTQLRSKTQNQIDCSNNDSLTVQSPENREELVSRVKKGVHSSMDKSKT